LNWYTQTIPGIGDGPLSIRYTGTLQPLISGDHLIKVAGDGSVRVVVNGKEEINTFETGSDGGLLGGGSARSVKISLVAGQAYSVLIETRKPTGGFGSFLGALGSATGIHAGWTSLDVPTDLASYDAVIVSAGFNSTNEGENYDRAYELPDAQGDLIRKIAAINPHTIVVLHSGGSVETASWIGQVPVVLHAWYSGQYGGQALAESCLVTSTRRLSCRSHLSVASRIHRPLRPIPPKTEAKPSGTARGFLSAIAASKPAVPSRCSRSVTDYLIRGSVTPISGSGRLCGPGRAKLAFRLTSRTLDAVPERKLLSSCCRTPPAGSGTVTRTSVRTGGRGPPAYGLKPALQRSQLRD
jgi:hypothetical protein